MKEKIKNTAREIATQTTCRLKKSPAPSSGAKDFIVANPAARIGKIKKRSVQSILLRVFSTIALLKFRFKYVKHRNYLLGHHCLLDWLRPGKVDLRALFGI